MWFLLACLVFADTGEPGTTHVVPVIPDPVAPGTRPARGWRPAPSFVRFVRVRVGAAEASPVVRSPPAEPALRSGARAAPTLGEARDGLSDHGRPRCTRDRPVRGRGESGAARRRRASRAFSFW